MILTRRGYAVLGVVLLGIANASLYGPRALNAVVAPAAVALLASVVLVRRIDRPTMERVVVDEGFVGETHTVELRFGSEAAFTGHVVDEVPAGLTASGNEITTAIEDTTVTYDVTFARRGAHELGPTKVVARDVLGLAERVFDYRGTREILVYPRIHDLRGRARHDLNLLPDVEMINTRGEFDNLREYQRGDSLRDIDWKKSAKTTGDDMIVKEYVDEEDLGEVLLVAETTRGSDRGRYTETTRRGARGQSTGTTSGRSRGRSTETTGERSTETARQSDDAMAEAAASIATFLLDAGLDVGVTVPGGSIEPGEAHDQRAAVLDLLARTGPGRVPGDDQSAADLVIRANGTDVTVALAGKQIPFSRLTGDDALEPPEPSRANRAWG